MSDTVDVPCFCHSNNPSCGVCGGKGTVPRRSCARCAGSGHEASTEKPCLDCRGRGYRSLDNPSSSGDDVVIR